MAVVTFCSAKGSPGVTTATMAIGALWPRKVLVVDADPAGGDLALRLPQVDGSPTEPGTGLLSLAPLARRGLTADTVLGHRQILAGGLEIIAGLTDPAQSRALAPLWRDFAGAFDTLPGGDALVDLGRLAGLDPVEMPLLQRSRLIVLVLRPTVSQVLHARERLRVLDQWVGSSQQHAGVPRVGVLVVAGPSDQHDAVGAVETLRDAAPWAESLGHLAFDPAGAAVFEGGSVRRPERTLLIRTAREVTERIVSLVVPRQALMAVEQAAVVEPAPEITSADSPTNETVAP